MGVHTGPGSSCKETGDRCAAEGRPRGELRRFEMTQRGAAAALLGFKNTQVGVGTPAKPWASSVFTFLPSADKVSDVSVNLCRSEWKDEWHVYSSSPVHSGVMSSLSLFQTISPGRLNKVNRNLPISVYSFTVLETMGRFLFTLFCLYVNIYSIMSNFQMPPF